MKSRKTTTLGLALGLLAGGGAGLVLEMTGSAGASSAVNAAPTPDDSTDTTTASAGTGTDATSDAERVAARAAKLQDVLQPLVDAGTISQAQADAVITALQEAAPRHDGHGRGRGRLRASLDVVATTLGLTGDEVKAALTAGQTIAELAVANGKTADDVIAALVADLTAKLDEKVAAGTITQAQADEHLANATARITTFVNAGLREGGFGGRHSRRADRHARRGRNASADDTTTTVATDEAAAASS